MSGLRLFDGSTRMVRAFTPADPERVTLYVCGPTVYDRVHIGNARGPVVFDVLVRLLRADYANVVYARNITDVDDKINKKAFEEGVPIQVVAGRFEATYRQDMADLGVAEPDVQPRATEHIDDMIDMTKRLISSGHAYAVEGSVFFDTRSMAQYGVVFGIAGDAEHTDVEHAGKRAIHDFVLWKPSRDDQPGWMSPWGRGRPGWHIECSAMIEKHLGAHIDIHGGGDDLKFPHHENECAQSSCAHGGQALAGYWVHNGMINMRSKMSKSGGNAQTVRDLLNRYPGEALRWSILRVHYRSVLDWSDDLVVRSEANLDRLYGVLRDIPAADGTDLPDGFLECLRDDLNTPAAISILHTWAGRIREADADEAPVMAGALKRAGQWLGVLQADPELWFTAKLDRNREAIDQLVLERAEARERRDYAQADRLRTQIEALGARVEDSVHGARIRKS